MEEGETCGELKIGVETGTCAAQSTEDAFELGDLEPSVVEESWLELISGMSLSSGN